MRPGSNHRRALTVVTTIATVGGVVTAQRAERQIAGTQGKSEMSAISLMLLAVFFGLLGLFKAPGLMSKTVNGILGSLSGLFLLKYLEIVD